MSNLSKLEFMALDISGKNYFSWVLDAEIHLTAKGLGDCLKGRYDHFKATVLPRSRYEWMHLQFQDYKTVIEQHNDLLMKNHEARPAGSAPLPEAHTVEAHSQTEIRQNNQGHDNAGSSQKNDENVEANLALKDDAFDGLDDITHLEAEDFFGDRT
ncbi:uncharacterized protein LOC125817300 [Solanum verrucosum]|uniref:uncharacterized protein LOC125817300 n=1 Tax=Solanum verrucosum TaxID=315347 RepID=UPI0020D13207|nr:uncharacterized protein LOC125817300 [Solanum verrucosum]